MRADAKGVTLEDRLLEASPFDVFAQSKLRERDRDIQFMTAGGAVASHSCTADRKSNCHRTYLLKFMCPCSVQPISISRMCANTYLMCAVQIVVGDVCGSGFNAKRNGKVCALHTTCVSPETLLAYWDQVRCSRELLPFVFHCRASGMCVSHTA